MLITNEIIENYFECNYKSFLKLNGVQGEKCNLENLELSTAQRQKQQYLNTIANKCNDNPDVGNLRIEEVIAKQRDYASNVEVPFGQYKFKCDLLKKVPSPTNSRGSNYFPILVIPSEHIPRKSKILIAGIAHALGKIQSTTITVSEIIYGRKFKSAKIKIEPHLKEFHKAVDILTAEFKPSFHLNSHCSICEFSNLCKGKAIDEGHLSLLKGITKERIEQLTNKGIFSINQLSYTFRPRRKALGAGSGKTARSVELNALAIREQKIYIYNTPAPLPRAKVEMFLDIEGLPDENFYYLIGLTIKIDEKIEHHFSWANDRTDELTIVTTFLSIVSSYKDFVIYHYGSYEITFLNQVKKRLPIEYNELIEQIMARCYNILSILFNRIYFPTFSNSLKEIGGFIGFKWSAEKASGIESIFWRKSWEISQDNDFKSKLIKYNQEDCLVLISLLRIVNSIIENRNTGIPQLQIVYTDDLKKFQKTTFIANESFFPEIKLINECSYFDYQREKVYAKDKTSFDGIKNLSFKKGNKKYFYHLKPDKKIDFKALSCGHCKSEDIFCSKALSKKVIDLKFQRRGIKVFVTLYTSYIYKCMKCKNKFTPNGYPKGRIKLGHNLIVWTIYQHIVNKQGFRAIENSFKDFFHIFLSRATFFACKDYFVRHYELTYNNLLVNIIKSTVLYVDETPFTMQFEKGYVWVFTNGNEVVSIYKSSREAAFLKEFLKGFTGVLVTDFYNGYDSMNCRQQKCLIHLIRDFNSDLIRNPFNEEFKNIAKGFTALLQRIVSAVDRFGLKKYHLNKYKKDVNSFFTKFLSQGCQTDIAQQYQTRLNKNRNNLFEFLNHDNVGWNNSNAEHAIKILALHTNKDLNAFRKTRIDDYLKIMSIYQSCEYKNISFLKFLLSENINLTDNKVG